MQICSFDAPCTARNFRRGGFTLAELLVVVAIVAVLVVIAVPVFGASLAKAQTTTCLANRTSLLHECTTEYLAGDYDSIEAAFTGIYAERSSLYVCPDGGTFSFRDGSVVCSKHGDGGSLGDKKFMDNLFSIFSGTTNQLCDSTAADVSDKCETAKVEKMLAEKGLSLSDLGAAYWQYDPRGFLYWTDTDIRSLSQGTTVPCIRYNANSGSYTIWSSSVVGTTTGTAPGVVYPVLDPHWKSTDCSGNVSTQTYSWALQALKAAQGK